MNQPDATILEPARRLPVGARWDVVVCGGGPAGIAAAVSARRTGAEVLLLEAGGCVGGVWTRGLLSNIIDAGNKGGFMEELLQRLRREGRQFTPTGYDVESMKWILEQFCLAEGVDLLLHTRVVATHRLDNRLDCVITENASGRQAWRAGVFVDCTGNGDLAAAAGCGYDMGDPADGGVQPLSLMALVSGIQGDRLMDLGLLRRIGASAEEKAAIKTRLHEEFLRAGFHPSFSRPILFPIRNDLLALMVNHQYGVRCDDADALSKATLQARDEVNRAVQALRSLGGCWSDLVLSQTADHIGVREGRRIHGLHTIVADDLVRGDSHPEAVCRCTFCVDIHSTNPGENKGYGNRGVEARPYDIPRGSLIAKDVDGLLMAGRCISGDFFAHASYRVTGNAVAMGEYAGCHAALAALSGCLPPAIPHADVMERLGRRSGSAGQKREEQ